MIRKDIVCSYLYVISKYGYPPPAEDTIQHLKEMKEIGFQAVELEGIRSDHLKSVYAERISIRDQMQRLNLEMPYFCIVLPGLSSSDSKERDTNLKLFEIGCETASFLGAKGVLDNGPLPPYQFPEDIPVVRHYDEDVLIKAHFPSDLNWSDYWHVLVETYRYACDIAKHNKLTYHMHPCLGVLSATTDGFLYFRDAVGRENLRFNLDTANQFFFKENLSLSLTRLSECIEYIHLSDNRGTCVEHLVPEKGNIHWDLFFQTLDHIKFKGHIGLDIGGEESGIENIDEAYSETSLWLQNKWKSV